MAAQNCPACGSSSTEIFHEQQGIPTNSCLLLEDADEARDFPRGDLRLALCVECGFIYNELFDPSKAQYSAAYEETQSFSPRFREFARDLAKSWVDRYDLAGKHVLEVGCGKGEFLVHMVQQGAGTGTGIDPGVHPERIDSALADRLTWIADFYDERYAELPADAVVCRHTLEHIAPVRAFMDTIRRAIGDRPGVAVLFELPDTLRVLDEAAFWDVYYEHCSYFSAGSLVRLFRRTGFDVFSVERAYDDQYLLLEARPHDPDGAPLPTLPLENDLDEMRAAAQSFRKNYDATVANWRTDIRANHERGGRTVIWGGGSKGVAFLAALGADAGLIDAAVDINPFKQGRYIAGTGHQVISPDALVRINPSLVIAMNSVYLDEIGADLLSRGLDAELRAV